MEFQELICDLKSDFPEDVLDIKECLELLSESINSTFADIQKASDSAYTKRDFHRINHLANIAEQTFQIQDQVNQLVEQLDIDSDKVTTSDNSDEKNEIRQLPDYSKYVVDKNIPHNLYEDFTNKCPAAFSLYGEKIIAEHWKDVFLLTCETLAKNNNCEFEKAAMDKIMQGRKIDYFSSTGEHMRKPVKLKSANIYVETNLSANQIRNIVAKLLRLCNLSITDYNIFLRADYTSLHE